MAAEDNFLRLDNNYFFSEAEKRVFDGDFTLSDVNEIFQNGCISMEEYEYCLELLQNNNVS